MPRSTREQIIAAINRVVHREMYWTEFIGYALQQSSESFPQSRFKKVVSNLATKLCVRAANNRLHKYFDGQRFNFNGALLPDVRSNDLLFSGLSYIYNDIFKVHCEDRGDYSYKVVDPYDSRFSEGTYFFIGPNDERIILKPGDVVVDAGAWIGDFSSLAAHLLGDTGAVYAFEPSLKMITWLEKTASYYKNLIPVPFGLGDINQEYSFRDDEGGMGSFVDSKENYDSKVQIMRLDDWVLNNKINKIDFIKADIEGFERKMLLGATNVLREFGPILSICTYHLPDDPIVIKKIILESNPKYKIIQRQNKLFAFIP